MNAHNGPSMSEDRTLQVQTEERPQATLVRLSGDVGLANYLLLIDAMQPAINNRRNIIVELSAVRYMDSSGLHALIDADQKLRGAGCRLIVVGASPLLARVFEVIDLPKLFPIVPTVDEAARVLAGASDRPPA